MAHPTGTSTRVQRLTTLVAVVAVAVASGLAYGRIYQGGITTVVMIGAGVASGLLAWGFERRSLFLATAVSAVALLLAVTWLVFPETTWYGVPTLDTLRAIGEAAGQVGEEARLRVSPTEPIDPLVMAGLVGVWAALFSCHALAFRAGSPLLALVPPLALVVFADSVLDEVVRAVYGVFFLVAGLAVVFADAMRRLHGWGPIWAGPGRTTRLLPSAGRGARRIAVTAVAAAAIAPFVMPGFGGKAVIDISAVNQDERVRVSPLVSVAAQLTSGEPVDVFEVETEAASYWRMTALERFDGIEWSPGDEPATPLTPGQDLSGASGSEVTATFTVLNDVGYDWLPVGVRPESLEIDRPVTWAAGTETLETEDPLDAGDSYVASFTFPEPSAAQLETEVFPDPSAYPSLVQLPEEALPGEIEEIETLAREWTEGASNDYERIQMIEARFNDVANFQYSTNVSPREDGESLVEFLTISKRGFCQQFAAAMAVMLRTLDIPARVAVGYTPGKIVGTGDVHLVSTENLHAWVEVLFPTYGWLPFEPTPGRGPNPAMASYATGAGIEPPPDRDGACTRRIANDPDCLDQPTDGPDRPRPTVDPFAGDELTGTGGSGQRFGLPAAIAAGLLAAAGLFAVAFPARRAWRRRRLVRRAGDEPRRLILASYDVFADRAAELGLPRGVGETPREYARRVVQDGRVGDERVERLATLTTRAAYAPAEPSAEDALDAAADAHVVLQELAGATPLRQRVAGRLRLR